MVWSYFSCGIPEKVRFRKTLFLKDDVQTVAAAVSFVPLRGSCSVNIFL